MWYDKMFEEMEKLGDEQQAEKMSAYMQEQFRFQGIPKPELKKLIKPYLSQMKKQDLDWGFVYACWDKPYREAQYTAIEYLLMLKNKIKVDDLDKLQYLIVNKSWWETVDTIDAFVGDIVLKEPSLKTVMLNWSLDDNIWLRRVAIDYQQEYKMQTDTDLLGRIIKNNLGSKEFFINKAIGWSLRDYSKVNPEWVRKFVDDNRERMAPLSIKEATKML